MKMIEAIFPLLIYIISNWLWLPYYLFTFSSDNGDPKNCICNLTDSAVPLQLKFTIEDTGETWTSASKWRQQKRWWVEECTIDDVCVQWQWDACQSANENMLEMNLNINRQTVDVGVDKWIWVWSGNPEGSVPWGYWECVWLVLVCEWTMVAEHSEHSEHLTVYGVCKWTTDCGRVCSLTMVSGRQQ